MKQNVMHYYYHHHNYDDDDDVYESYRIPTGRHNRHNMHNMHNRHDMHNRRNMHWCDASNDNSLPARAGNGGWQQQQQQQQLPSGPLPLPAKAGDGGSSRLLYIPMIPCGGAFEVSSRSPPRKLLQEETHEIRQRRSKKAREQYIR